MHPIGVVARRTGLTTEVIRAWEQRYGAVEPARSEGGQRLYRESDVRRLSLLASAVSAGHRIGAIATLPEEALLKTVRLLEGGAGKADAGPPALPSMEPGRVVEQALAAVAAVESKRLGSILRRSAVVLEPMRFLEDVMVPFLEELGARWERGEVTPAHEHLASGVVRDLLSWLLDSTAPAVGAPLLLVGIPQGQRHEFGAMLAGVVAGLSGWSVLALGGDLPARDIGALARQTGARAVALSVVYGDDAARDEVERLRTELPEGVGLLVGGRAAAGVLADPMDGVERVEGLAALRARLESPVPPRVA